MPDYFHYTSRKAAQDIVCGVPSCLRRGKSGKIWLTQTRYATGCDAARELAIENEIGVLFVIPDDHVPRVSTLSRVNQIDSPDGVARVGGGFECTIEDDLLIGAAQVVALGYP